MNTRKMSLAILFLGIVLVPVAQYIGTESTLVLGAMVSFIPVLLIFGPLLFFLGILQENKRKVSAWLQQSNGRNRNVHRVYLCFLENLHEIVLNVLLVVPFFGVGMFSCFFRNKNYSFALFGMIIAVELFILIRHTLCKRHLIKEEEYALPAELKKKQAIYNDQEEEF